MPEKALKNIASQFRLTVEQVSGILKLLDEGFSIPYIARYHPELGSGLGGADYDELINERKRLEKLDSRRRKMIKKLSERDMLSDDLKQKLEHAADMRELLDHYVPYRPRKRSLSRQAIAQGLSQLAHDVYAQEEFSADMSAVAEALVDPEQGLEDTAAVLEGVFHIVVDWVAEEKSHRDRQRAAFAEGAQMVCSRSGRAGRRGRDFRSYFDFRAPLAKLHPWHMLSILRGKRMRVLQHHMDPPLQEMTHAAAEIYLAGGAHQYDQSILGLTEGALAGKGSELTALNSTEFMAVCLRHSINDILVGIASRETERELGENAEHLALDIIRRNVAGRLMAKPLMEPMMGIHPGYRTGCNLAVLDGDGNLVESATAYPHAPQNEKAAAKELITALLKKHNINTIVIGDGTAAGETEDLISELIADEMPDASYCVVAEIGVDAWARSRAARNELPKVDPRERCAVAVCRYVRNPLRALVQINPRDLCPEQYVDDVNGGALKKLLDEVVEECVCAIGVDVNTGHPSMLRHVAGVTPELALQIVDWREKNGPLASRAQLRAMSGMSPMEFKRTGGFLRVSGGANPLDNTRIHPDHYPIAEALCEKMEIPLADLATEEGRKAVSEARGKINLAAFEKKHGVHYLVLKDMLDEMISPDTDPREHSQGPALRTKKLSLATIEAGQWLPGTVRNIVDFGVFVDVGVGEDGLVHISELSDKYVESPYDLVSVGDPVRVRVVRVDQEKNRIALSMRAEGSRPVRRPGGQRRRPSGDGGRRAQGGGRSHAPVVVASGKAAPRKSSSAKGPSTRTPMSTRGAQSRRVQKASIAEHLARQVSTPMPVSAPRPDPDAVDDTAKKDTAATDSPLSSMLRNLSLGSVEHRGDKQDE